MALCVLLATAARLWALRPGAPPPSPEVEDEEEGDPSVGTCQICPTQRGLAPQTG